MRRVHESHGISHCHTVTVCSGGCVSVTKPMCLTTRPMCTLVSTPHKHTKTQPLSQLLRLHTTAALNMSMLSTQRVKVEPHTLLFPHKTRFVAVNAPMQKSTVLCSP